MQSERIFEKLALVQNFKVNIKITKKERLQSRISLSVCKCVCVGMCLCKCVCLLPLVRPKVPLPWLGLHSTPKSLTPSKTCQTQIKDNELKLKSKIINNILLLLSNLLLLLCCLLLLLISHTRYVRV